MPSHKLSNKVVVASAGSRKTTCIVEEALAITDHKVLLTTYTNENVAQIYAYIVERTGHIPKHITVLSWFSFLLQEGVRPYQNYMTRWPRIETIDFLSEPSRYNLKSNVEAYYLNKSGSILRDKVAEFVCACDNKSGGLIIKRLSKIYGTIFVDELQDLAGYDLTFLEKLFYSPIKIVAVGDPRQATFSTHRSQKNKQFKRAGIIDWIDECVHKGLISVEHRIDCFRSNQMICDFADALFPDLPRTKSYNILTTGHDGIHQIEWKKVMEYFHEFRPTVLRYNRKTDTLGLIALNIGLSKGKTFDRVLIFPTKPMKEYLTTKDLSKDFDVEKLYVAVTRAKYSATFVV